MKIKRADVTKITKPDEYDLNVDGLVDNSDKVDGIDIPNTIANVLTDHNKATHDALNIDADTVDGIDLPNTCVAVLTDHNRTTHDALGTGSIVFTDETQTLTNKTLSTGCTITLDNGTYLRWKDSAGTTQNVIGLEADDLLRISAPDSKPIIIGVNRVNPIQIDNQGVANATTTTYDSNQLRIAGNYWNGTNAVDRIFTIQHHMIDATPTSELVFKLDGTDLLKLKDSGDLVPASDNSSNLGTSSLRWANVYTKNGDFDGTLTVKNPAGTSNREIILVGDFYLRDIGNTPSIWFQNTDAVSKSRIFHEVATNKLVVYDAVNYQRRVEIDIGNGNLFPSSDNSSDLGTSSYRWKNVYCVNLYSGDINLENGWKITEHPEHGVVLKSPSGKTYKFKLEEVK